MQQCSRIFLVTLLECILFFLSSLTTRADLNFIHYAGQIGAATDIIPGEFEG